MLTVTFGNLAAFGQNNLKRLLAYSTIAHAGYMLMGLAVVTKAGAAAVAFYLAAYVAMNLGAFGVVALVRNATGSEDVRAFRGLVKRNPLLAARGDDPMAERDGLARRRRKARPGRRRPRPVRRGLDPGFERARPGPGPQPCSGRSERVSGTGRTMAARRPRFQGGRGRGRCRGSRSGNPASGSIEEAVPELVVAVGPRRRSVTSIALHGRTARRLISASARIRPSASGSSPTDRWSGPWPSRSAAIEDPRLRTATTRVLDGRRRPGPDHRLGHGASTAPRRTLRADRDTTRCIHALAFLPDGKRFVSLDTGPRGRSSGTRAAGVLRQDRRRSRLRGTSPGSSPLGPVRRRPEPPRSSAAAEEVEGRPPGRVR